MGSNTWRGTHSTARTPFIGKSLRQLGRRIFYKPEYLNRGGSGKGRAVSFLLYYYLTKGRLKNITTITTAGFGNFIRTLTELLPTIAPSITPKAHMGERLQAENPELVHYLQSKGTIIDLCTDGYCPTGDMDRGKAISNAYIEEQLDSTVLMLDQHGVFKPLDGFLNASGYYYSLAPEIIAQTQVMQNRYYVNGQGTRGSLLGTATGLKTRHPDIQIVGLRQQEGGHIFGLRSKTQLGKSASLGRAEERCDLVYEISDQEAYSTMNRLWHIGIPATPSGGSYIAVALRLAKTLPHHGNIVTLVFDSLDYYKTLLQTWIPKILDARLNLELYLNLRTKAFQQRMAHIRTLTQGKDESFNDLQMNPHPQPSIPLAYRRGG